MIQNTFKGKTILVTGGTGSFGNAFLQAILETHEPKQIIIFSRDEKKQHDMRISFNNHLLKFYIGDVRDREVVFRAMQGVDYVFHAAALKQVPSCEFFPMEAIKTNILGFDNVLAAADYHRVKKVVVLSTDKAVYPINAMGMSKALMEKLFCARARQGNTATVFCGVRYGNVMYSRGSVIPLFVSQIKKRQPITITNPAMTRFLLPLSVAVELVLFALAKGEGGDIFVRKSSASTIFDLAQACINIFQGSSKIENVGIRAGEKMHETLVTQEELIAADEFDNYFRIKSIQDKGPDDYFIRGQVNNISHEGYTSANTRRLSVPEVEKLLLSLPEIQAELI